MKPGPDISSIPDLKLEEKYPTIDGTRPHNPGTYGGYKKEALYHCHGQPKKTNPPVCWSAFKSPKGSKGWQIFVCGTGSVLEAFTEALRTELQKSLMDTKQYRHWSVRAVRSDIQLHHAPNEPQSSQQQADDLRRRQADTPNNADTLVSNNMMRVYNNGKIAVAEFVMKTLQMQMEEMSFALLPTAQEGKKFPLMPNQNYISLDNFDRSPMFKDLSWDELVKNIRETLTWRFLGLPLSGGNSQSEQSPWLAQYIRNTKLFCVGGRDSAPSAKYCKTMETAGHTLETMLDWFLMACVFGAEPICKWCIDNGNAGDLKHIMECGPVPYLSRIWQAFWLDWWPECAEYDDLGINRCDTETCFPRYHVPQPPMRFHREGGTVWKKIPYLRVNIKRQSCKMTARQIELLEKYNFKMRGGKAKMGRSNVFADPNTHEDFRRCTAKQFATVPVRLYTTLGR